MEEITQGDILDKFKDVFGDGGPTAILKTSRGLASIAGLAIFIMLIAYLAGRRRGRIKNTIVEIKRI